MLSKTKGEDAGIKTVKLARGSVSGSLLQRPAAKSRLSAERQSLPRTLSSGTNESAESERLFSQIGIAELLEQDDRPTFIVDLSDNANYTGGPLNTIPLNILFANTALRSCEGLLEAVSGIVVRPS